MSHSDVDIAELKVAFSDPEYSWVRVLNERKWRLLKHRMRQSSWPESCCGFPSLARKPNNRLEFALARPTRKSDALLLAAQPERYA
jgi:hypothetical protein